MSNVNLIIRNFLNLFISSESVKGMDWNFFNTMDIDSDNVFSILYISSMICISLYGFHIYNLAELIMESYSMTNVTVQFRLIIHLVI